MIEPIKCKINNECLQCLITMPNCLGTYKKNDAVSLSSKYGELYMMAGNERWKNYDGIIIDGLLYLY